MKNDLYPEGATLRNRHRASHRQFWKSHPTFFVFPSKNPRQHVCYQQFWNHPFSTIELDNIIQLMSQFWEQLMKATLSTPLSRLKQICYPFLSKSCLKNTPLKLKKWLPWYQGCPWVLLLSQICFSIQGLGLSLSLGIGLYNNFKTLRSVAQWLGKIRS